MHGCSMDLVVIHFGGLLLTTPIIATSEILISGLLPSASSVLLDWAFFNPALDQIYRKFKSDFASF